MWIEILGVLVVMFMCFGIGHSFGTDGGIMKGAQMHYKGEIVCERALSSIVCEKKK